MFKVVRVQIKNQLSDWKKKLLSKNWKINTIKRTLFTGYLGYVDTERCPYMEYEWR